MVKRLNESKLVAQATSLKANQKEPDAAIAVLWLDIFTIGDVTANGVHHAAVSC